MGFVACWSVLSFVCLVSFVNHRLGMVEQHTFVLLKVFFPTVYACEFSIRVSLTDDVLASLLD